VRLQRDRIDRNSRLVIRWHNPAFGSDAEGKALRETQMGSKILLADDSITIQKVVNLTFSD